MLKIVLGLVKGAIVGAALGYGADYLGLGGGFNWITYGVIGVAVGLFVGRPIWTHLRDKQGTFWTPVLKALVGYGVGVGLYALVAKAWGGFEVSFLGETRNVADWSTVLGGAIGALYGAFVEIDDADPVRKPRPS